MKTYRKIFLLVMLFGLIYSSVYSDSRITAEGSTETAPDFTIKDKKGEEYSLKSYSGKTVVLNFFASWCPPCIEELPDFAKLYNKLKKEDKKVEFLGIAVSSKKSDIMKLVKKFEIEYPVLFPEKDKVSKDYSIKYIPTTYIISPTGKIEFKKVGGISYEELEKEIEKVLTVSKATETNEQGEVKIKSGYDVGNKAILFSLQNKKGQDYSLKDYQGKVVVVNFFADWCPPCVTEIPDFVKLYSEIKDKNKKDIEFIAIAVSSRKENVLKLMEKLKINYPVVFGDKKVSKEYNIEYIPTTLIVDANGIIRYRGVGGISYEKLKKEIEKAQ